ncbi:MAG: protein adenylyltransferase SelO [Ilumatobacteraceae bacterium]
MSVDARPSFVFDNTFARDLTDLYESWQPAVVPTPSLLALNADLAVELGLDPDALRTPEGVAMLVGNAVPDGASPLAQAYAGHQFGNYSPRLGDGRAVLLGELIDTHGRRRDLHLKGSGRTPFARGGDGKAVVGPMLRELLIGEAMHALGIPTTRALAVIATGEGVQRQPTQPGAVLARVASSHLRVGTFQFAAATDDLDLLQRLTDYAIARHHPAAAGAERPALALLDAVIDVQAQLVAQWMLVGFIHGVMNTDNVTISGETIDYGPCAFMDAHDPTTVFSSIDHAARYAYGNQPAITQWNLARLAEALLPLIDTDAEVAVALATETLQTFADRFTRAWSNGQLAKIGLTDDRSDEAAKVAADLLDVMREHRLDHTATFRSLSAFLRAETPPVVLADWAARWLAIVPVDADQRAQLADRLDAINPLYIPRNHLVDEALEQATIGDMAPFERLLAVVSHPFVEQPDSERYAEPASERFATTFRTYCGT